jgi:hypothetical protein
MTLVAEAVNGREAIQQFRTHRPDVTLTRVDASSSATSSAAKPATSPKVEVWSVIVEGASRWCGADVTNA